MPSLHWPEKGRFVRWQGGHFVWVDGPQAAAKLAETESFASPPARGNCLVVGDNARTLPALAAEYGKAAKLIYLDPPFNTKGDIEAYQDSFAEGLWLSMMQERLALLAPYLADDGLLALHIDARQLASCQLLLDELFGREARISLITLEVKNAAGVGLQSAIFDVCEYILLYSPDPKAFRKRRFEASFEWCEEPLPFNGYVHELLDLGEPQLVKTVERALVGEVRILHFPDAQVTSTKQLSDAEYIARRERIFAHYNPSGGTIKALREHLPMQGISAMEYRPSKGKDEGQLIRTYFYRARTLAWLRDIARVEHKGLARRRKRTNLWHVPTQSLHAEGGVTLRSGKKPEALLTELITIATDPGELVLDPFAGSGTTAACAHRLGRPWLTFELPANARELCIPRLRTVAEQCGGGFRVLSEML